MIFLIEDWHHIAVEKEKIRLFQITFGNQVRQYVILAMYIIYHCKWNRIILWITCLEHQRFFRVDISRGIVSIDDLMSDMAQYFLYEDAITIVRPRFKPFKLHGMDRRSILYSITGIIIFRTFSSIKVRIIIRRQLHPTDRWLIRQPYDRHFIRPQILQIGTMH